MIFSIRILLIVLMDKDLCLLIFMQKGTYNPVSAFLHEYYGVISRLFLNRHL